MALNGLSVIRSSKLFGFDEVNLTNRSRPDYYRATIFLNSSVDFDPSWSQSKKKPPNLLCCWRAFLKAAMMLASDIGWLDHGLHVDPANYATVWFTVGFDQIQLGWVLVGLGH